MNLSVAIRTEDCALRNLLEYAFYRHTFIDRAPYTEILLPLMVELQARRMIFRAMRALECALKVVQNSEFSVDFTFLAAVELSSRSGSIRFPSKHPTGDRR
jgi:hypothetical protein